MVKKVAFRLAVKGLPHEKQFLKTASMGLFFVNLPLKGYLIPDPPLLRL